GRDDVLEDHHREPGPERLVALDEAAGAVVLHFFPHVERVERAAPDEAHQRDRARERAAAELDAGDRLAPRQAVERVEHQLAHEGVPLGSEDRLLAVDEEVALPPGGEDDPLPLERTPSEQLDQAFARGRRRSPARRAHRAPFFRSWAFWPFLI